MSSAEASHPRERDESLWWLAAAPTIWSLHFLLSYVTAAIWCAKVAGRTGPLGDARSLIALYTAVALVGIAWVGWRGWRSHRMGEEEPPHDRDTPEDRHRFLGFATVLLSALSAVATIYVALAAVFLESCI